jgi:hypothetical protein
VRMLHERGGPGNCERAELLIAAALHETRVLGMTWLMTELEALARS